MTRPRVQVVRIMGNEMKTTILTTLILAIFLLSGCGKQVDTTNYSAIEPPSPFLAGIQSYQSIEDTQNAFTSKGFKWHLNGPRSRRWPEGTPPRDAVIMFVDEYSILGHQGELILHFFNDRLQRMCFTPKNPTPFFTVLQDSIGQSSLGVVSIGTHTKLTKITRADGRQYANWEDTRLKAQADKWLDLYDESD